MRLLEPKIKAAILHPDEEVRVTAVSYFSGSFSQDETIMPLVIQAVETYGREKAFRILRAAESLTQTHATAEWLVRELRRGYDVAVNHLVQQAGRLARLGPFDPIEPEFVNRQEIEVAVIPQPFRETVTRLPQ